MDNTFSLADVEKRIRKPGSRSSHLKALIYGEKGVGKTTLAMTAPNPFLLNIEPSGDDSVEFSFDDERVLDIRRWEDIGPAYELLYTQKYRRKFDSIILDTVSELEELCGRWTVAPGMHDPSKLITAESKLTDKRDWGTIGRHMGEVLRKFLLLADDYHIIILGQERTIDRGDNDKIRTVDLRPASIAPAGRLVSLFAHLSAKSEIEYDPISGRITKYVYTPILTVVPTPGIDSKDRTSGIWMPASRKLPPVMVRPDLTKIIRRYRGESAQPSADAPATA